MLTKPGLSYQVSIKMKLVATVSNTHFDICHQIVLLVPPVISDLHYCSPVTSHPTPSMENTNFTPTPILHATL